MLLALHPRTPRMQLWMQGARRATGVAAPDELPWCQMAKGAVRTGLVVFDPPSFEDDPCLKQAAEEFTVQALVAQLVVEPFDAAILSRLPLTPRAAWGDVDRLDGGFY